jgi:predicted phosphodiesterase
MRLALFSDVHGNPIALDAVLADVDASGGVDGYLVLGDVAEGGYDPSGAVERLAGLPEARFVRGNSDRSLAAGQPGPSLPRLRRDPHEAARVVGSVAKFAWAHGHLVGRGGGGLAWLAVLPLEQRLTLPDGTRLLAAHAAPGSDGSDGRERCVTPAHTDDALRALLAGCAADLVCVGHTHWPLDRTVDGVRIVNVGSVSNPWAPDLRACWVLLEAGPHGFQVELRRVAYDLAAVLGALQQSGHPAADEVAAAFRGAQRAPWLPAASSPSAT